jgi:chromosome segregation ATPase
VAQRNYNLAMAALTHVGNRILILLVLTLTLPVVGVGQQTMPDEPAALRSLVEEVRRLRIAVEQSTSLVPRIQLSMQRTQLQQDRVDRLSKQLSDLRTQMAGAQSRLVERTNQLKFSETRLNQELDPGRRKDLENMMEALRTELQEANAQSQRRQAEEAQLSTQLQTEQAKLTELSDQLTNFDRMLGQLQSNDGVRK